MAEFTKTEREAQSLLVNSNHYTFNKRGRNGNSYWRCVDRSCAGCATLDSNGVVVSENNNHNHTPNLLQAEVSKAVDQLKDQAAATAAPMASVYNYIPPVRIVPKQRKRFPPMPTTIDDVTLSGEWAKTLAGDPFCLYEEDNIHLLANAENVRLLAEAEDPYIMEHSRLLHTFLSGIHSACIPIWVSFLCSTVFCLVKQDRCTQHASQSWSMPLTNCLFSHK